MARRVAELGEHGLIERLARLAAPSAGGVPLGIGDDAALLRTRPDEDVVATTDALVEGVHFRLDQETPRVAGRRALAANLSDLAAMGARPLGFLWALAVPPARELAVVLGLARGLVAEGARAGCPLVGGNVARAGELSVTITALGAVGRGRALRRDAARVGDRVLLTGTVGRSALERAQRRVRHVPEARLGAGRALARARGVGACIDLSDGLAADAGHVAQASGVALELDAARVPRPRGFAARCRRAGLDPDALSLAGGEDYELLFTVRPGAPGPATWARRLGVPVAEIGRVVRGRGLRWRGALPELPEGGGWRHF